MSNVPQVAPADSGFRARLGLSCAALAVLIIRCLKAEWIPNDVLSAGLLLVAALPWLVTVIEEAEMLGGRIKFRKLEQETEELRKSAEETRQKLDRLILSSLSPRLVKELQDFANQVAGPVRITNAYLQELWHLHNLGYVRFRPPCPGFDDVPRDRDVELFEYLEITPLGREYLELAQSAAVKAVALHA